MGTVFRGAAVEEVRSRIGAGHVHCSKCPVIASGMNRGRKGIHVPVTAAVRPAACKISPNADEKWKFFRVRVGIGLYRTSLITDGGVPVTERRSS